MLYSIDFRKKVIAFFDAGHNKAETARQFLISVTTLNDWLSLREEKGSLHPAPLVRRWRKLDPSALEKRILAYPDALLKEHAEFFGVCIQTISNALTKLGFSRKKRP